MKYVQRFKDQHGKVRHYLRKPGCPRIALPGLPGSDEFMEAYREGLRATRQIGSDKAAPGSLSAVIAAYYQSAKWAELKPTTQKTYRQTLERFRTAHGSKPASELRAHHLAVILDGMKDRPDAANNLLKRLKGLYRFALKRGLVKVDPTVGVDRLKSRGKGHRAWSEDDIQRFEKHWPAGSRARLALRLLLYTGQRRSDAVRMGWQHVSEGKLRVIQQKTGTALLIPLHPALKTELDCLPKTNLTFLMTAYGRPMSAAGFTNWFRECARKAGLPNGSAPHGLRKAAARRLADAGCTTHQIAAITGHLSLKEVERYSKGADQARLAEAAIASLGDRA
ncbi:MAG: tyrosine-type recombinase/integrase [Ignavibacteriales bacterium]